MRAHSRMARWPCHLISDTDLLMAEVRVVRSRRDVAHALEGQSQITYHTSILLDALSVLHRGQREEDVLSID